MQYGIVLLGMVWYGRDIVQFTKLLIMQFSSVSCYLHPLGPTYLSLSLSLHSIFEHLQPVFFAQYHKFTVPYTYNKRYKITANVGNKFEYLKFFTQEL